MVITLPASSAENERGFSLMKRIKTNFRSRIHSHTLSDLMTVHLLTSDVHSFDPRGVTEHWFHTQRRSRDHSESSTQKDSEEAIIEEEGEDNYFENDEEFDNELSESQVHEILDKIQ